MRYLFTFSLLVLIGNQCFAQFAKNPQPAQLKPKQQAPSQASTNMPPPPVEDPNMKKAVKYYQDGMKETNLNNVISKFSKAIELNPNYREAIFYRGVAYYQNKNAQKAINDFNKMIQIDPRNFGAYMYRGRAKESLKLFEDALNDYNKALKMNPKFAEGLFYRGQYFKNNGNDAKKACEDLSAAKQLGFNVSEEDLKACK